MTLGATPQPADVVAELGLTLPYTFQKSDARPWDLAGLATSADLVFPTSFANKSVITQTDSRTTAATSHATVSFGAAGASRWVIVLAWHGNTGTNPGQTPTCTIGGVAATRIAAHSTGDGASTAVGVAMFVAQPSGTTGTVAVTWGSLSTTIVALRVVNYNCTAATSSGAQGTAGAALSIDIPNKGILIAAVGRSDDTTAITWTNVTEKADESAASTRRSWGWDSLMATQSGRSVSYSPFSSAQGATAVRAASFPLA